MLFSISVSFPRTSDTRYGSVTTTACNGHLPFSDTCSLQGGCCLITDNRTQGIAKRKFILYIHVSQTHAIDASQLGRPLRQDVVMVWPTENAELTQETPTSRCGQPTQNRPTSKPFCNPQCGPDHSYAVRKRPAQPDPGRHSWTSGSPENST